MKVHEIIEIFIKNHTQIYQDMKNCEHGFLGKEPNPHHLEGSIWTHTMMVLKKAEDYGYNDIIKLSCLCHDLGKPYVYEDIIDKSRRRFTSHEAVSTFYTKEVLKSFKEVLNLSQSDIQFILSLVAQHGSLYNFFEYDRIPQKNHHKIVDRFDTDTFASLFKLYKCDHEGRFYTGDKTNKDVYEDFETILELMEIRDNSVEVKEIKSPHLIVMIGVPRSGKSTYVKSLNYNVVSRDDLVEKHGTGNSYNEKWKSLTKTQQKHIDTELMKNFQNLVKEGKNIVVDMTNMSKKSRKKWLVKNYKKTAVLVIESKSVIMERMTSDKNIPEYVVDNMMKSFVYPNLEEFDEVMAI
jgi:predicted kinase